MIKVSKKVEYALMALKYINDKQSGQLTSAREVCDDLGVPFDSVSKVMQKLNSAKILHSTQGIQGGYSINKPLEKISLLELSELIEKKKFALACMQGSCELHHSCNISTPMINLNNDLRQFFAKLSLKELLSNRRPLSMASNTNGQDEVNLL